MNSTNFKAERISQEAEITLNGNIEKVFLLFGAFEERKWAKDWNPVLIYPDVEIIEDGTIFRTEAHGHDENNFLWRVTKYEPAKFVIQYLITTENRQWTITIKCNPISINKTKTEIDYTYIGLNEKGNKINRHSLNEMFKHNLKDWEKEINTYLENIKLSEKE